MGENVPTNFGREFDFHVILGIFYMPQIYDMGQTALLPSEGRRAEDFFDTLNTSLQIHFFFLQIISAVLFSVLCYQFIFIVSSNTHKTLKNGNKASLK